MKKRLYRVIILLIGVLCYSTTIDSQIYQKVGTTFNINKDNNKHYNIEYVIGLNVHQFQIGVGFDNNGLYNNDIPCFYSVTGNVSYSNEYINIDLIYSYNNNYRYTTLFIGYNIPNWYINTKVVIGFQLLSTQYIGIGIKFNMYNNIYE